jgi:hypothetical protein
VRSFFQPSRFDRTHGWKTVRLHDRNELPIKDESQAIAACGKLAEIYLAWKQGKAGFGPHLGDVLGRPVGKPNPVASHAAAGEPGTRSPDRPEVTLAERACGEVDRLDPP